MEWIILFIVCGLMVASVAYFDQRRYCYRCHRFVKLVTTEEYIDAENKRIKYKVMAVCPECGDVLYINYYWEDM